MHLERRHRLIIKNIKTKVRIYDITKNIKQQQQLILN